MPSSSTQPIAADTLAAESDHGGEAAARNPFLTVFPGIVLPMFMAAVDQTIVSTALPAIAASLGEVERVSWVVVSYLVANCIAAPVYGRLGDAFGRRRLMFLALAMFVGASVLCAISPNIVALSFARVLQGLGGGGLMTLSQALIGEAVPPRERGRYQAWLASIFMASSTFGPVAGGWLTARFGWQSVFMVNLPLGALAALLALRLPRRKPSGGRFRFDALGTLFFATFVTALLLALEQLQRLDQVALPTIGALVALAAAALVLLLRQERRAASPLLPLALFRQAAIWRCDALGACIGATLVSLVTFVPIYLEIVRGTGPSETGFLMLPLTGCIAVGSLFTGQLISRTGRTAVFPSVGLVVVVAALLVLALAAPRIGTYRLPWLFAVGSLTMGTAMPVVQMVVQQVAGPRMLGTAAASVQLSRSIGAALGTAIVGAVLFATLSAMDPQGAALFAELVERGPSALAGLDAARRGVLQAEIADAFRAAFLTIAGFAAIGLGLAWSIPVRRI